MNEHGTMDFDFRKRFVVKHGDHDVIFYGVEASDFPHWLGRDLKSPFVEFGLGRTSPIELKYAHRRHFFNKRIMTDDERIKHAAIQAGRDEDRVRACYGIGGASRAEEVAAAEGCAGSGGEGGGEVST